MTILSGRRSGGGGGGGVPRSFIRLDCNEGMDLTPDGFGSVDSPINYDTLTELAGSDLSWDDGTPHEVNLLSAGVYSIVLTLAIGQSGDAGDIGYAAGFQVGGGYSWNLEAPFWRSGANPAGETAAVISWPYLYVESDATPLVLSASIQGGPATEHVLIDAAEFIVGYLGGP